MNLTEADHKALIAEMAATLIRKNPIDLDEFTVIPVGTVGQCLGVGPTTVKRLFPLVEVTRKTRGVRADVLRAFIAKRTTKP